MINRYFTPTRYEGNFYTPPLDLISDSLKMAQQKYDTNYVVAEEIKNKYINALPQDRATANTLQQGWNKSIDDIVAKYSGDYSQASKDLNKLLSDIRREMGPGGQGQAIEYNYNTWNEAWSKVKEGVQKGDYSEAQASLYQDYFNQNYQGVQKDPSTGLYSLVSPEPLAKYVDTNKIIQDRASKLPKRSKKTVQPMPIPGDPYRYTMVEQEVEYIDPVEAENSFAQALYSDGQLTSMLEQNARFAGLDPNEFTKQYIQGVVQNSVPLYSGVFKENQSQKVEYDQVALKRLDHNLALQRQREREAMITKRMFMKDAIDKGLVENPLAPTPKDDLVRIATLKGSQPYKPVDPSKGVEVSVPGSNLATYASAIVGSPLALARVAAGTKSQRTTNVNTILSNKNAYSNVVNIEMLEAAKQSAAIWRDKSGNPSRDINSLTWEIYNNSLSSNHFGEAAYIRRFSTSDAMQEEAERTLPMIASANLDIWQIDANGTLIPLGDNAQARQDVYTQLYDHEKGKPKVKAIGKSSVQTGLPFGTVFPNNKGGYYIVAEPHEDIRNMNNEVFNNAFGFMRTPDNQGGFFSYSYEGQLQRNFGKYNYYPDPTTGLVNKVVNYYNDKGELVEVPVRDVNNQVVKDSNGNVVTRPATPADMEEILLKPQYRRLFDPRSNKSGFPRYPEVLDQE